MAILGAGTNAQQQALVAQRTGGTQSEGTTRLLGVAADPAAVRRAVARELAGASWGWVRALSTGRRRRVTPAEVLLWVDQVVSETKDPIAGDLARAHRLGADALEGLPFRVVVTPDAVVMRWCRSLGGDRDAQLVLQRLVVAGLRRGSAPQEP